MTFQQKLDAIIQRNHSFLCIGLDTDLKKIPPHLVDNNNPQFTFNKAIIDATQDLVCAYKPNTAFYEAQGAVGIQELKMTCDYLHDTYPEIPVILDAKRADIGNTNEGYVTFAFDYLHADAITLHPYLGKEALTPFLQREDKGCMILCRTSNPGSGEFQDLVSDGESLYKIVARKIVQEWNGNSNCALVVGATYPTELAQVRSIVGDITLLIPGVGAQGGDLEKTVQAALNSKKTGIIINSSRAIIFASSAEDYAARARFEAQTLKTSINSIVEVL